MTVHETHGSAVSARRGFLGRLLGGTAAVALIGASPTALIAEENGSRDDRSQGNDWMAELKGTHRTVFDMSAHGNGKPLTQAKNYLDAWRDAFKVPERDLNLVIGCMATRFRSCSRTLCGHATRSASSTAWSIKGPRVRASGTCSPPRTRARAASSRPNSRWRDYKSVVCVFSFA